MVSVASQTSSDSSQFLFKSPTNVFQAKSVGWKTLSDTPHINKAPSLLPLLLQVVAPHKCLNKEVWPSPWLSHLGKGVHWHRVINHLSCCPMQQDLTGAVNSLSLCTHSQSHPGERSWYPGLLCSTVWLQHPPHTRTVKWGIRLGKGAFLLLLQRRDYTGTKNSNDIFH